MDSIYLLMQVAMLQELKRSKLFYTGGDKWAEEEIIKVEFFSN